MRCDGCRVDGRNNDRRIGDTRGVAAIAAQHTQDRGTGCPGVLHGGNQVRADVALLVTPADRQYEYRIVSAQAADFEPFDEAAVPALVVDARGELGGVVRGRIAFDARQLAEIVDSV